MMNEKNKVWFITGASSGFGLEMTKQLLANGNKVAATSRNKTKIEEKIGGTNPNLLALTVDVTNEANVKKAIDETVNTFGKIDVAVNNAGYMLLGGLEEVSAEEYHQSMNLNVYAFLHVIRNVMPHFRQQKSGHIFNFASSAGYSGDGNAGAYNSVKWAVIGLSEALVKEASAFGVKVTVVAPGLFRTSFLNKGGFAIAGNKIEQYNTQAIVDAMYQYDGHQPGNPAKLAVNVINMAEVENPPLHLPMGPDAYERATGYYHSQLEELQKLKELSSSTNFD